MIDCSFFLIQKYVQATSDAFAICTQCPCTAQADAAAQAIATAVTSVQVSIQGDRTFIYVFTINVQIASYFDIISLCSWVPGDR